MCKSETHQVPLRCRQGHGLVPVPSWPHTGRRPRAGGQCILQEKDTRRGEPEPPLERRQGRDLQWKEKLCHVSQQSCSCLRAQIREESHKREVYKHFSPQQQSSTCPSHLPPHLQMLPLVAWTLACKVLSLKLLPVDWNSYLCSAPQSTGQNLHHSETSHTP